MPLPDSNKKNRRSAQPLRISVVGARPGVEIEVVPGKSYLPLEPQDVDTLALAELVPAGDGTYRPVARICGRWWTLSRKNLRRLGIAISESGLARLVRAGFVRGMRVTPNITQFDYFDYLRHERAVYEDDEFWDRTEPGQQMTNRERYRAAL